MRLEDAKQELIRRYRYLYENSYFILAPYMYEQSKEEYEKIKKEHIKQYGNCSLKKPLIYLNINALDSSNYIFEEFLLSDKNIEDTILYKFIESKREDIEYLEQVKKGLELVERENIGRDKLFKISLNIFNILNNTWKYVSEQSGDLENKENKLNIIDEYYRIGRYKNDGKIYTSGRNLNIHDVSSIVVQLQNREPLRDKKDIGIINNPFITAISKAPHHEDNWSIFTEKEKQKIYLDYHDELPCDLEITCDMKESYNKKLDRPDNTKSCGENFIIKEEEIFVNPDDKLSGSRYYQLCPHCGYIVNIPKKFLSDGVKKRIEERCLQDDKLFRKMYLYSELFSLDKTSTKDQKKLLKK